MHHLLKEVSGLVKSCKINLFEKFWLLRQIEKIDKKETREIRERFKKSKELWEEKIKGKSKAPER